MVILRGIWTFLLSLYPFMSLTLFFLLFSTIAEFPSASRFESACLYIGWRGCWSSLYGRWVSLMMWCMKHGSVPTTNDH